MRLKEDKGLQIEKRVEKMLVLLSYQISITSKHRETSFITSIFAVFFLRMNYFAP